MTKYKLIVEYYKKRNNQKQIATLCSCSRMTVWRVLSRFQSLEIAFVDVLEMSETEFAHNLPFVLLSDTELSVIQAYGTWQEKKLYGKVSMGVVRTTFLIDEQGVIQEVMPKVKPDTNADEILALLEA